MTVRPTLVSIQAAARGAGLKPDTIRAWERRYGAVVPIRTSTGRRLYADADVQRLRSLRMLTGRGHRIGDIAALETNQLQDLLRSEAANQPPATPNLGLAVNETVQSAIEAIQELDGPGLRTILDSALVRNTPFVFIRDVAVPILETVGRLWWNGIMHPGHEHLMTGILRSTLMDLVTTHGTASDAPSVVVAAPAGQRHEVGALLAAVMAANAGWRVHYLGADLPASAITDAVVTTGAAMLALSITFPPDDGALSDELRLVRRQLPGAVRVVAGGAAVHAYASVLDEVGVLRLTALDAFSEILRFEAHQAQREAG